MNLQTKKDVLINSLIAKGALKTKEVVEAFRAVKREEFVLPKYRDFSYRDEPLPIMKGQTISQPYTVARMTEELKPEKGNKILEVGAGSGYQAAILSKIVGPAGSVVSIERISEVAEFAKNNLQEFKNVKIIEDDGTLGYEKEAPYDRIIVTASAPSVPEPLVEQLKPEGRMVIPVDDRLVLIEKDAKGRVKETFLGLYAFVPLIGKHGHKV